MAPWNVHVRRTPCLRTYASWRCSNADPTSVTGINIPVVTALAFRLTCTEDEPTLKLGLESEPSLCSFALFASATATDLPLRLGRGHPGEVGEGKREVVDGACRAVKTASQRGVWGSGTVV